MVTAWVFVLRRARNLCCAWHKSGCVVRNKDGAIRGVSLIAADTDGGKARQLIMPQPVRAAVALGDYAPIRIGVGSKHAAGVTRVQIPRSGFADSSRARRTGEVAVEREQRGWGRHQGPR